MNLEVKVLFPVLSFCCPLEETIQKHNFFTFIYLFFIIASKRAENPLIAAWHLSET